ncbi:MAG: HDOD domain-containing protein [Tepidisphaera sp.]
MALSIDRVVSCPNLPTLPAVAVQVLELTRDPNVTVAKLAKLVQADPSLSAKVLRTVNSSFFGLPAPCSKIDRALAMLGLNTIKALVLGFTLVEGTKGVPGDMGLDLTRHWRRAVYAAAASRHVASTTGTCDPDEAFTAAMLQDIGMMACIVSLPEQYAAVLGDFKLSHEHLPARERGTLGFDHAMVGAALARKWRLPEHLARAIEHHHDQTTADSSVKPLARAVWIGMVIAETLGGDTGENELRSLITVADFFECKPDDLAPMLAKIAEGADSLAKAFDREVGSIPDIKEIMAVASEQILETQLCAIQQTSTLERQNQVLALKACTDALTGACNRAALDTDGVVSFDKARASATPFSVIFVDADRFKSINDTYGHAAGDAVLVELVARISAELPEAARVYRYGGEEFAVLAPGLDAAAAASLAERFRVRVERESIRIPKSEAGPDSTPVTISLGYATTTFAAGQPAGLPALLKLADEGVYKAKHDGRNRVCCVQNASAPAFEPPRVESSILLIEDDPFSARLVLAAVQKATGTIVTWVKRVDEAVKLLQSPQRFKLVLCDYHLGRRSALDVLSALAGVLGAPPVHVMTSDPDGDIKARCMAAGAARFSSKDDIAADLSKWCRELTDSLRAAA